MKASSVFLALLSATFLTIPATAQAEAKAGSPPADRSNQMAKRREERIKRFDKEGDGKLDAAERAERGKAREKFRQKGGSDRVRGQRLKRFDQDGDGRMNEAERAKAEAFRAAQVKRFDRDGDGQLNEQERAEARKAYQAEHPDFVPPGK